MIERLRGAGFHTMVIANAAYPPEKIAAIRAAIGDTKVLLSEDGDYTALTF